MLVHNLQKKIAVDHLLLQEFGDLIKREVIGEKPGSFSIALISDRRMKQLNEMFRGRNATTDVLSFPHEPDEFDPDSENLGDIVISVEQAQKQADENGLTLELEIKQLILHGLLHLIGHDHETDSGEMNRREIELREVLSLES